MVDQSPLLPLSQLNHEATQNQKIRAYVRAWVGISSSCLAVLTVLPYMKHGIHACDAIPNAFAAAITFMCFGLLKLPGQLYNMYKRVKAGELPSAMVELSGQDEDGNLCELYKGQLILIKIDQLSGYMQLALGDFWLFPLAIRNWDKHNNPESGCTQDAFSLLFIGGVITMIVTGILVLVILAALAGCIKKSSLEKMGNKKQPGKLLSNRALF